MGTEESYYFAYLNRTINDYGDFTFKLHMLIAFQELYKSLNAGICDKLEKWLEVNFFAI